MSDSSWVDNLSETEAGAILKYRTRGIDSLSEDEAGLVLPYTQYLKQQKPSNSFGDEAVATVKQAASNIGNLVVTTPNLMAGGLLSAGGDLINSDSMREMGEDFFKRMEDTNEMISVDPKNAPQSMAGKVVAGAAPVLGAVAMGGGALPAMLVTGYGSTAQGLVKGGVDTTTANTVAAIDTAGNLAGGLVPGGRLVQALTNPVAGAATDYVNQGVLESGGYDKVAKQYDPLNVERRLTDAFVGGVLPPGLRNKEETDTKPTKDPVDTNPINPEIKTKLLQEHSNRLEQSITAYTEQINGLREAGAFDESVVKLIEELEAARQHDVDTFEAIRSELDGTQGTGTSVEKHVTDTQRMYNMMSEGGERKARPVELGPDEQIPLHVYDNDAPRKTTLDFDPETGEILRQSEGQTQQAPKSPKASPVEVAVRKIGEAMSETVEAVTRRLQQAEEALDNIDKTDYRDDTPGSAYSSKKESLKQEIQAYKSILAKQQPDLSWFNGEKTKQAPTKVDSVETPVVKQEQPVRQKPNVDREQLMLEQSRNQDQQQRQDDGTRGSENSNPHTVLYAATNKLTRLENLEKNLRKQLEDYKQGLLPSGSIDFGRQQTLLDSIAAQQAHWSKVQEWAQGEVHKLKDKTGTTPPKEKEQQLRIVVEETAPTKYDSVESLVKASAESGTISKSIIDNPDLVNQIPNTKLFFDKRLGIQAQNYIKSLLNLTQLGKDRVIILLDTDLTSAGNTSIEGNTTIIRLNPDTVANNLKGVTDTKFFKKLPTPEALQKALKMVNDIRYYAHEIGHAVFYKYIRDTVTHMDDLRVMYKDWQALVKENKGKFELNSLLDASKDPSREQARKDYQKNFSEYFAERMARQLLQKHVVSTFSKYKAIAEITKVINASADFLKSKGVDLNKENFTDQIINDILNGSTEYIKNQSAEAARRVNMANDTAAVVKAKEFDKEVFPFYKKTTEETRDTLKSLATDESAEGLGYSQNIFPSKQGGDNITDPTHRPFSLKASIAAGGTFLANNLFGKNYVASMFRDNPHVQKAFTEIRKAEAMANSISNKLWFGDAQRNDWNKAGFFYRISKLKSDLSAYMQVKNASDVDAAIVHDLFKQGFEKQLPYDVNKQQNGNHLNPKQLKLYDTLAKLFEGQYLETVKVQTDLGKKNLLPHRDGWYPAARSGPYSVAVGFNGDTVYRQDFRSKPEADLFRKEFERQTGKTFTIGEAVYKADESPITQDMFKTIDFVENVIRQNYPQAVGPIHDKIQKALDLVISRGGKLGGHHNFRTNLGGYLGSEIFHTQAERGAAFKRAIQGSVTEYAGGLRNMMITHNTDMMLQQLKNGGDENTAKTVESMLTSAKNRTENKLHGVDAFLRNSWDSALLKLTGEIPANNKRSLDSVTNAGLEFFYLTKLMSKVIFPINQALAFTQSIRQMSYDGGFFMPYIAMGKGMSDLISSNKELQDSMFDVSQKTNTFEPQFMEAIHLTSGNNKLWEGLKNWVFLQRVNEGADSFSRTISYAAAFRMYRDLGLSVSEAQTRAIDATDLSMVSYGKTEVAPILNKTGMAGAAIKPLQTYGQAALGNFVADFKYMKTKDPKTWAPMLNYALVSTLTAGAMSLLFVQEYEMMRKYLNKTWPDYFNLPSVLEVARVDPSMLDRVTHSPEDVAKAVNITASYGVLANTGIDVMSSSRANETFLTLLAAVLTGQKAWFEISPLLEVGIKGAQGTGNLTLAAASVGNTAKTKQAVTDLLPAGSISYGVKDIMDLNTTKVAGKNTDMVSGGKDSQAIVQRGPLETVAGYLGTKSTHEKQVGDVTRLGNEKEQIIKEQQKALINKFHDTGDKQYLVKLAGTGMSESEIESGVSSGAWKRLAPSDLRFYVSAKGDVPTTPEGARKAKHIFNFGLGKAQ